MKARTGPGRPLSARIVTEASSRTTSRPRCRAAVSSKRATSASSPLTEGIATSSLRSAISVGKVHSYICRLFLPADDHRPRAGAGEDLEEDRVVRPAVDDVGPLDAAGRGPGAAPAGGARPVRGRPPRRARGGGGGGGEGEGGRRRGAPAPPAGRAGKK